MNAKWKLHVIELVDYIFSINPFYLNALITNITFQEIVSTHRISTSNYIRNSKRM